MDEPRVSIVIPCYNGEPVIGRSLDTLLRYCESARDCLGPAEIVVVDDGSTDASPTVVERGFPGVTLLRNERNRGKGAAVRRGMLHARGRFRFFIDADLPFALDALPDMLRYLDHKEFDIVIGRRDPAAIAPYVKRSRTRRVASAVFTELVGRLVVTGVRDTQCGLKGFRAAAAEYLFNQCRVDGFAFDVECLYLAFKNDMDVKRLPVRLVCEDVSSVSVLRHGPRMLFDVCMLPLRYHLGRYALNGPPGRT